MTSHARCRSCNAPIVWMLTSSGKSIPVEPSSLSFGDQALINELPRGGKLVFDAKRHKSHFARCPKANEHRKKKP